MQILAAAATARHFGGEKSAAARKWEKLAQDNAARLDAMRAQQYRQEQARYVQAQMPSEEISRLMGERVAADRDTDRRAFDAAGALALSYVAVKSLPPFDKLAELSCEHLTAADVVGASRDVGAEADADVHEQAPGPQAEEAATGTGIDLGKSPAAGNTTAEAKQGVQADTAAEAEQDADVSGRLEQVDQPAHSSGRDLGRIGSVLETAGRGIAPAIGPVNGDDEVASPLSPVDMSQLSQELLSAIGAAMNGHPRSVNEMLNIGRQSDHTHEAAFVLDMGIERQETALSY